MRRKLFPILMAIIGLGMLTSLQACFDEPSGWGLGRLMRNANFITGRSTKSATPTVTTAWSAMPTMTIAAARPPQVTHRTAPTVRIKADLT